MGLFTRNSCLRPPIAALPCDFVLCSTLLTLYLAVLFRTSLRQRSTFNVRRSTFAVRRSTAITKSFWFGYILKLRAVLASWHALGSLKNAQQKILLRFASNLRIIHFWRICCVEMNRRPASAPLVRLCFASCSIPSKCMNNLREKVLGTHVKRDTPPNRLCPVVPCLLKKVSQTNHPPGQIASS